jgi:formate hydrogenlyase transcriptional activator
MDKGQPKKAGGNLLVVDDDLHFRQILEALLIGEGYEVRCAPSGDIALMFAREDPPDLILLDVRLPDTDGFAVCRRLREDPRAGHIPVIFISGLDEVVDKVKGFAAGGVDYLTKPVQREEVLARVGSQLDLKRSKEALQRMNEELELRVADRTAEIKDRLRFEKLLSDLSARFVNIPPDRVDPEIEGGLKQVLDFFQVDRVGLIRSSPDRSDHQITHGVYSENVPSVPVGVKLLRSIYPWVYEKLAEKHEVMAFSKLDDLPPEANVDKQTYAKWGVRSALDIPIITGGAAVHVIAINSVKSERAWPEEYIPRLRLLGEIFVNALVRRQMEEQLHARLREIEDLKQQLEMENIYLREEIKLQYVHEEIVGRSEKMKKALSQVEQVARTDSTVLIQGETGTGKELLARAIHQLSNRKGRPLVTVNCASLPPTLIESELFGREKGAYTGALTRMVGRFEMADGATLFLDEIGELPQEVQSKLLRVLEEGRFERLGSTRTLQVDVRIIAATNRDLAQDVNQGKFRKDLFYRLNVFPVEVPPLREHPEDIPLLVWAFVKQLEKRMGKRIETVSRKTLETLQQYSWPGNVRELRNVVEHAMISSSGKTLIVQAPYVASSEKSQDRNLEDMERNHILDVLAKTGWRMTGSGGAAEILGLKRTTLQSRMKKLGIKKPGT